MTYKTEYVQLWDSEISSQLVSKVLYLSIHISDTRFIYFKPKLYLQLCEHILGSTVVMRSVTCVQLGERLFLNKSHLVNLFNTPMFLDYIYIQINILML